MSATDSLTRYAEGWTNGDAAQIMQAAAPDYVLDDPNAGRVTLQAFDTYFADLSRRLETVRGGPTVGGFLELSHVVTSDQDDVITAWCWWRYPGTEIEGSGLIVVDETGVRSERLAYFTSVPALAAS